MVQANPSIEPSSEKLIQVEDELFEVIDQEIIAVHDWCKELVENLTQRYENLARRHLDIVERKLALIRQAQRDFVQMGRVQAQEQMKQRLPSILQTEENREPLLIGAEASFCNSSGEVLANKVKKGLSESE